MSGGYGPPPPQRMGGHAPPMGGHAPPLQSHHTYPPQPPRHHIQHGHGHPSQWQHINQSLPVETYPVQQIQQGVPQHGQSGPGGPIRIQVQNRQPIAPYPPQGQMQRTGQPHLFHQHQGPPQHFNGGPPQQVVQHIQPRPVQVHMGPPQGGQPMGPPPLQHQQQHVQQQQPPPHHMHQHQQSNASANSNPPVMAQFAMATGNLLDKSRLDELVRQVDPSTVLEDNVKDTLLEYADEFVDEVIDRVCRLVKHRGNTRLEVRDVELVLNMVYDMPSIPRAAVHVFGTQPTVIPRVDAQPPTEAHKQRMMLIRKQTKKP